MPFQSAEEFVRLRSSENPDEYLRAAHDTAPVELWLDIIRRFPAMKPWVIHNKTVPLQILELLSTDSDPEIRCAVADKRKLNRELFDRLSRDENSSVRQRIVYNPKTPRDILLTLRTDPDPDIAHQAIHRLEQQRVRD